MAVSVSVGNVYEDLHPNAYGIQDLQKWSGDDLAFDRTLAAKA